MQSSLFCQARLDGAFRNPLNTSAQLPHATKRRTPHSVRAAAKGGEGSSAQPPSRRELLANTLRLLSAAGVASVTGEQVREAAVPPRALLLTRRCPRLFPRLFEGCPPVGLTHRCLCI